MYSIKETVMDWGESIGMSHGLTMDLLFTLFILLAAWVSNLVGRRLIIPSVKKVVEKTNVTWDDHLLNEQVMNDICQLVPAFIVNLLLPLVFTGNPVVQQFLIKASEIYIIAIALRFVFSFSNSLYSLSNERERTRNRPLKGVFQMIKILAVCIGVIFIFSILLDKSPFDLFVGLGAAATVLMLVFKDTIVGLVAGVQLSANDMLRPGDWINMPKYGADGVVFEVNLTTVKVRNWDNTIVTVPPYTLVSDSFQNWRGMFESGGRRIKRSISIDMTSVRFCTSQELQKYRKQGLVQEGDDKRELTNITMLRRAILDYLKHNPRVNQELMVMVRQLQPSAQGMPLELYFFSADKQWVAYETLQADVFDYVMAIVPQFGLKVFQSPMGDDLRIKN
ncbi:MAG: mechanosensitive ion channel family protein [Bacteroidaceae bacterium]|nr:mechanosensitive ion channel family protein [Bacteroidaceae bacterium]